MSKMKKTCLKDYCPLNFDLDSVYLEFDLAKDMTQVLNKMEFSNFQDRQLKLYGEDLKLKEILLNDEKIDFKKVEGAIILKDLPDNFSLSIKTTIYPAKNTALSGLYQSGEILVTQNEPQGFRQITYFPDRPDVMTKFTTKLIGDKKEFPVMLSNGNAIGSGELENGKHFAIWEDPFKKPAYLFAVAAGEFDLLRDKFVTMSGREIDLRIYTDLGESHKAKFAMESLKNSMKWDEEKFGLEYDLNMYIIVAVSSFNSGAMENKGLNVFNSSCVFADPETATDSTFMNVEGVIGHEYFHNWTGNRVTCRDWFQLTLKEGLTVFRDQLFSEDLRDETIKRVEDAEFLKATQFTEDDSPNAHPIKPKEYLEMRNFYTTTVYYKGAEVIRMMYTLLGEEGFRKGMDLYFERHDGQAVTTEDFVSAMENANNFDFSDFVKWYDESGTPKLKVEENFKNRKYSLQISKDKKAMLPLKYSLYNKKDGEVLKSETLHLIDEIKIELEADEKPVLSLNQNFSAPIIHDYKHSLEDSFFLVEYDKDFYNRYDAVQNVYLNDIVNGNTENSIKAFDKVLKSDVNDYLKACMLKLPNYPTIFGHYEKDLPIENIYQQVDKMKKAIQNNFKKELRKIVDQASGTEAIDLSQEAIGKRAIKNVALNYLDDKILAKEEYSKSLTMTEKLMTLQIARDEKLFKNYLEKYSDDQDMIVKYFQITSSNIKENPIEKIKELLKSDLFNYKVPNLIRGLIGVFTTNYRFFFTEEGMKFFVEQLKKIDKMNPEMAARLCGSINFYPKLSKDIQKIVYKNLKEFYKSRDISKNTYEILNKIFG
ncbi:MAG: aminopeptidase N [Candidatus Moranbacteria bacterium]|nr:aminopeptidase N [Candidatus Moranbacteria bacterium]